MNFPSQDALYYAGAISLLVVSGFLCWLLYELARMVRQGNKVVEDAREKITRIEGFIEDVSDRVGSASQYFGVIAAAGKEIFGWMKEKRGSTEDREEEWAEEVVKKKRRKLS